MPDYSYRILTPDDLDSWQTLWKRSERYMFLNWRWAEVAAAGSGEIVRIGVFDRSGAHLLAGFAFVERKNRFMTEWRHPAPAPFAGILCAQEIRSESFFRDTLAAMAQAVPARVDLVEIIFQPGVHDLRGLIWSGWEAAPHYNYVSDLTPPKPFGVAAENSVHRQAEKARRMGRHATSGLDQLPELLALWEDTRRRHRIPVYVHPDAWGALAAWINRGSAPDLSIEVLGVREEHGAMEAGALLAKDSHRVYYLLGASQPDALGSGAPTLLHFEAAALVARKKWPLRYDWVGANTPSIAQFKKKFRPELETLMLATWKRPRRKLMEDARSALRGG